MKENKETTIEIGNKDLDHLFNFKGESKKEINKRSKLYKNLELIELYEKYLPKTVEINDVVNATLFKIDDDYIYFKCDGLKNYILVDNKPNEIKKIHDKEIGDNFDVYIINVKDNNNYEIKGSLYEFDKIEILNKIKNINEDEVVEIYVKSMNQAGYNVDIIYNDAIIAKGFMPNTIAGVNKIYNPESLLNKRLFAVIELYSEDEGTYIVNRKKYLQSLIKDEISKLEYNKLYTGHVTGTTPFGIFVEFNECLTGMIHKSCATEELQKNIEKIKPGYKIDFYIKEIINDKIILTQTLKESIWDKIKVGQKYNGKIKEEKHFGLLVELDDETTGLIHTSELEKSDLKLNVNDTVDVEILSFDRMNRKIYLKIVK